MAEPPTPDRAPAAGITITRVFDAPREAVWKEWTEPERFADWFGGSESEVPLSTVSMDVRPGGSWRLTMFADPGRREIHWHGEYREVVERLVFTLSDQPGEDAYELITCSNSTSIPSSSASPSRPASSSGGAGPPRRSRNPPGGLYGDR